jgi:hypothetical protein
LIPWYEKGFDGLMIQMHLVCEDANHVFMTSYSADPKMLMEDWARIVRTNQ